MAETAPKAQPAAAPVKSGKFNLKTLLILVGVFVFEGAAISAAFLLFGAPADIKANFGMDQELIEMQKLVEIRVVKERFPNTRSGRDYLYETEIYIQTKMMHQERVEEMVEGMKAQLTGEIAAIFRAAEPSDLHETTLGKLNRRVHARLNELIGQDADGNDYIDRVLIPKCTQFRLDL